MPSPPRSAHHAAIFVDYANLHALLADRLDAPKQAAPRITEALSELGRYLSTESDATPLLTAAYADFRALDGDSGDLQQALYHQGIEPRFVPARPAEEAVQMQLAVDATALAHRPPGVRTVAVVTGDHTFLPLAQALRRAGTHALVAALDPPPAGDFSHTNENFFMELSTLLSDETRRNLTESGDTPARRSEGASGERGAPAHHDRLDDEMLFRTLEIAEEHFGQYDEIYLTPLLRKLSDVLGEHFDPKALVSDLEDARAVRLEKRRGYPYDYTVLIVERGHPDVQQMEEDFYDDARSRHERGGHASASHSSPSKASLDDASGYDGSEESGEPEPTGADGENDVS
jgi:hypothetical protein